jgi:hypothetical protein
MCLFLQQTFAIICFFTCASLSIVEQVAQESWKQRTHPADLTGHSQQSPRTGRAASSGCTRSADTCIQHSQFYQHILHQLIPVYLICVHNTLFGHIYGKCMYSIALVHCRNSEVYLPGIHGGGAVSFRTVGDFF